MTGKETKVMQKKIRRTSKFIKKASRKAGMSPGTLVHVGEQKVEKTRITLISYDAKRLEEKELQRIEEAFQYKDTPRCPGSTSTGFMRLS